MTLFSNLSRRVLATTVFALVPFTGAIYLAHAQTDAGEKVAIERALSAQRSELRSGRRSDEGVLRSPDGNYAVIDLGEDGVYGRKGRFHVVYDFGGKKVYYLRFFTDTTNIDVRSEALR